jgi:CDP-glucose 4,6-dehydratase
VIDPSFWNDRRVFVTGHTGFMGGWLSLWLSSLGAKVTGFALPPSTEPSLFDAASIGEAMSSVMGDVRNLEQLEAALGRAEPEIVFHMAAQPLVNRSYADPAETYATNVIGTVNVLEAVRRTGTPRTVVVITTDKVYENDGRNSAYRENDRLGGQDPYSSSKACCELVTQCYRDAFFSGGGGGGAAIASARSGNVVGGGDWAADRLVPDLLRGLAEGKPVVIKNPNTLRPWQHVLEPLSGYVMLAERLCQEPGLFAGAWNFGPRAEDVRPVGWMVDYLEKLWAGGAGPTREHATEAPSTGVAPLDSSKAHNLLGWEPRWHLEEALRATVTWHRAYVNGARGAALRAHSIDSIAQYTRGRAGALS